MQRECVIAGCGRQVKARGWCSVHYNRWRATGNVQADRPVNLPGDTATHCHACKQSPWCHVAPPCPRCRRVGFMNRYFPNGDLWRCVACHEDFRVMA